MRSKSLPSAAAARACAAARGARRPQPQPQFGGLARRDRQPVPEGALGAPLIGVDGGRAADHVVVDAVLGVRRDRRRAVQPRRVGLVLAEQRHRARTVRARASEQLQGAEERVLDGDRRTACSGQHRLGRVHVPGPGVAEPRGRQHVQGVGFRAGVGDLDGHQDIGGTGLGVVHLGDPVAVFVEHAGVEQLVLGVLLAASAVFRPQVLVGERRLRVVVAPAVPGVAGQGVQVPPVLLDVLAVVRLRAGQPERALLQDRVTAVPQRQPQAQPLLDVAEPGQAVLAPPVGPGTGCGRAAGNPTPRRPRCSPPGPCPTAARSRTVPTGTSRWPAATRPRAARTPPPAHVQSKRLYVTRQGTSRRRIANHDELLATLTRHGFCQVAPEHLSVREQIALFGQAEAVIGVHGAGLTNAVFSAPADPAHRSDHAELPPVASALLEPGGALRPPLHRDRLQTERSRRQALGHRGRLHASGLGAAPTASCHQRRAPA